MHTVLRLCEYLCSLQPHSVCNAVMFVHRSAATRFICCLPLFQVIETTLSLLTPSPSSSLLLAAAWLTTPHSLLFSCPPLYLHCLNFHKLPLRKPVFFTYKSSLAPFPKLLLSFFPSYLRNNSPPFFCLGLLIFLLTSWISLRVYVLTRIQASPQKSFFVDTDADASFRCTCPVWQALCWASLSSSSPILN